MGYFLSCACLTIKGEFKVDLSYCSIDDYKMSFLAKELSKDGYSYSGVEPTETKSNVLSRHLTLNLQSNKLHGGGVQSLSEVLHKTPTIISKLNLSFNKIQEGEDGLVCLLQVLRT